MVIKMKKVVVILLSIVVAAFVLTGCQGEKSKSAETPKTDSEEAAGQETSGEEPSTDDAAAKDSAKISLICDTIGTNPFLTQMVTGLKNMEAVHDGIVTNVVECQDSAVWEDDIRAAVQEGNDLIIVAGAAGTEPITAVADEFPEAATYVLIDAESPSENVKSISFKEHEGAYLIGMIAGQVNETDKFGAVHANENQSSYKWRWGYMQGAMAVRPELTEDNFVFNYTSSYTDAGKAKELALQQAAAGCGFINAASAVADFGTFEAALEKGFYTSGQDEDRTNPDNSYIITTQIKNTSVVIEKIIDEYVTKKLTMDNEKYGVKEGVIGALYVTHEGVNPRNKEVFTDEMVAQVKEAAEKISSGEIVLDLPMESN